MFKLHKDNLLPAICQIVGLASPAWDIADGIEAAWRVIDPNLQVWQTNAAPALAQYALGSWGPEAANELLARDDRKWRYSCAEHD